MPKKPKDEEAIVKPVPSKPIGDAETEEAVPDKDGAGTYYYDDAYGYEDYVEDDEAIESDDTGKK